MSGLNQQMMSVFLGLLFVSAAAWLFLSRKLYHVLQANYPGIYEKLGSPRLFMKKSLAINYRVLLFLLRSEYELTGDVAVVRLCQGLKYIFFIYTVCLFGSLLLLTGEFHS